MSQVEKLQAIRVRIDKLDEEIQRLINDRAKCAQEVAFVKQESVKQESASQEANQKGSDKAEYYRPEREAEILREIQARNQGPLSNEEIARLFREIMSACLALEQTLKIAYLGPEGTFTQAAALKHFGHSINSISMSAIDEVFREVESGSANYGVVPIENSTEGVINHTLDMFQQSSLLICGEVELRIHHHLLSTSGSLEDVKKIYSHQQSLAQCREWLDANLPKAERISVGSNAEAAKMAIDEKNCAAIAGNTAAEIYGLNTLVPNIEDEPDNTTRFLIIGNQSVPQSGRDKTSILVSAPNKTGALYGLLTPFIKNEISLTRIESRPSRKGMWEYVFFIDIDGHRDDEPVKKALSQLKKEASLLKVLGSYPCAVL